MQQVTVTLALSDIRTDGGTQSRAELSEEWIEELTQVLFDGKSFKDPVIVFYDGSNYWLADGFHRASAAKRANIPAVDADIKQGTQDEAIEYSCGANATHGLRRTNEDKRRAVTRLLALPKWQQQSNREAARQCGVTEHLVRIIRDELYPATKSQNLVESAVEPVEETKKCVKLRTPKEVVEQFFADYPNLIHLSNREIAKRCGVTEGTVRNHKKDLFPDSAPQPEIVSVVAETIPEKETIQSEATIELEIIEEPQQIETKAETIEIPEIVETITETQSEDETEPEKRGRVQLEPQPQKLAKIVLSDEVLKEREVKRQQVQERNEQLREKGAELPAGKYSCLVVDPPWTMQKIEREERPNQFEFDYPTMTEEELKAFPLPDFAANDCHLYLWTTQKHLLLALRLAEYWGFKYQCLLTWVKNVGMTPFSWMYSTEHVLFCTKGSLPLLAIGRRLDFSAKVREHSRKPDEFYNLVKDVSPGPRLDIFSREKRDGFDQYGNEVEKYAAK